MTAARRTGRPLQALAVLGALVVGWIAGRWPLLEQSVADAVGRAERAQLIADAAQRRLTAAGHPELAATPQRRAPLQLAARSRIAATAARTRASPVMVKTVVPTGPIPRPGQSANASWRAGNAASSAKAPTGKRTLLVAAAVPRPPAGRGATTSPARPASTGSAIPLAKPPTAFDLAASGYAALAAGDRRLAAHDFDAALAAHSTDPHVRTWLAARHALGRRWSASAYVFARPDGRGSTGLGPGISPGTTPLLGGSQSGAALAYTLDPLARRPLDLTARVTGSTSPDQRQAEAAVGERWRLLPGVSLSAERLIALGPEGRNDWTLRLAGGQAMRIGPVALDGYGETGIVGIAHPTLFAAAQGRVGYPIAVTPALTLTPGAGVWAGGQHDRFATTSRVDAGPGLRLHWVRARLPVDIAVDYRQRLAGNAAPGSGVALTLSTGF